MMIRKKGNWNHNYPLLKAYLVKNKLPFWESNDGQHFKIAGPTVAIELWPSRMTYHILESEEPHTVLYYRNILNVYFNKNELEALL